MTQPAVMAAGRRTPKGMERRGAVVGADTGGGASGSLMMAEETDSAMAL